MPAVNPRLTITLQPEVAAVLRRLSELSGQSQSSLVGELLEQSLPVFERMAGAMHAAVVLRDSAMQGPAEIKESLIRAHERIEAQLGLVLDDMDEGVRPLLVEAEKVSRRGARTAGGGARLASTPAAGGAPGAGLVSVPTSDTRSSKPGRAAGRAAAGGAKKGGSTPVPVTRGSGLPREGGKGGSGGKL